MRPLAEFYMQHRLQVNEPHHKSFEHLWETKWKAQAQLGAYPFMFGKDSDFESPVSNIVRKGLQPPYDWDLLSQLYFPQGENLTRAAEEAERVGKFREASELYLRASAVYRIARFPICRTDNQREAWARNKATLLRGFSLRDDPIQEVMVPHRHAVANEGSTIPVYLHLPREVTSEVNVASTFPVVILIAGLDAYRTELPILSEKLLGVGIASVLVEVPGTGDCPSLRSDPLAPDRLWSSLLDWIDQQDYLDSERVGAWGFSTGGFYALRFAHTHADRMRGVIAQGGGCHYMFDPEWLSAVSTLEYPFDLTSALAYKFGYGDDVEGFKSEAEKFSLLRDGTLDKASCRLLLVNGTHDTIFPVDDMFLCTLHGNPKEIRLVEDAAHMGEPMATPICMRWLQDLLI